MCWQLLPRGLCVEQGSDALCGLGGEDCHGGLMMSAVSAIWEQCVAGLPHQARFLSHFRRCKYRKYPFPGPGPRVCRTLTLCSALGWTPRGKPRGRKSSALGPKSLTEQLTSGGHQKHQTGFPHLCKTGQRGPQGPVVQRDVACQGAALSPEHTMEPCEVTA